MSMLCCAWIASSPLLTRYYVYDSVCENHSPESTHSSWWSPHGATWPFFPEPHCYTALLHLKSASEVRLLFSTSRQGLGSLSWATGVPTRLTKLACDLRQPARVLVDVNAAHLSERVGGRAESCIHSRSLDLSIPIHPICCLPRYLIFTTPVGWLGSVESMSTWCPAWSSWDGSCWWISIQPIILEWIWCVSVCLIVSRYGILSTWVR